MTQLAAAIVFRRTLFGYAVSASGEAPRAANFAGFNEKRITLLVFMIAGAAAGLNWPRSPASARHR